MYRLRYPVVSGVEAGVAGASRAAAGIYFIWKTVSRSGKAELEFGFLCGTGRQDERFTKK